IWEPFGGEGRQWSYADFVRAVRRFAAGLVARGLSAGDRVLIHMENAPKTLIAWLGSAYAGAVPVTTNTRSTQDELSYFAAHSRAVVAVTQPAFADLVLNATPDVVWRAVTGSETAGTSPEGYCAFKDIDAAPTLLPERPHDPWAPFGIQYTSGTTARPKAV